MRFVPIRLMFPLFVYRFIFISRNVFFYFLTMPQAFKDHFLDFRKPISPQDCLCGDFDKCPNKVFPSWCIDENCRWYND